MLNKNQNSIIRLANAKKSFDNKVIINDLTLDIYDGEFVTILGPSGCGKTTVLRVLAGLETLDSGDIYLDDKCITQVPAEKRNTNTVFQGYALFPHMTVFENIAFGLRMQKIPEPEIKQRVNEMLAIVKLTDFKDRQPAQLSGGQQQRVAIARAVVNQPKVLLLDESLSALDYKLRKEMQNELKMLQRKLNITFIFVTHDQEEALTMSDRIIVMNNGSVEQIGTPREIYETPTNLFVAKFIGEINIFPAVIDSHIDEDKYLANVHGCQYTISTDLTLEKNQSVNILLRPEDLRIKELDDKATSVQITGHIIERNYKGMTLDSVIRLDSGERVQISEFFDEDDPDFDHSLGQKVAVSWVESWEVILTNE
ncbi:spermidine/putrescine ABC transporter ATP-binding protein PotA [Moritella dasanensis]|uniref:spermidine/putrescine ABC transporter ATP-binding protein PotA n=1 Tax=Moritella dasanensis TaxID=428031 RepID=UPI0002F5A0AA|nr:spermidine/putrescine ABC transporter ATP-binding protein PotA [Moritella dasanensis]